MRCWTSKKRKKYSRQHLRTLLDDRSFRTRTVRNETEINGWRGYYYRWIADSHRSQIFVCVPSRARAFGEKGWTSVTSVMTSWQERERGSWFQLSLPPFLLFFQLCQPCYFDRGEFLRRLNFREDSFSFFFFFSLKVKFPIVARIYVYTHTRSTKLYVARYLSRRGPMPPQSRKEWF